MKRSLISLLVTVALLWLLFSQITFTQFMETTRKISLTSLFYAFSAYLLVYFFRALRLKLLLRPERTRFWPLLRIAAAHNFFNRILPVRAGELSLAHFINKRYKTTMTKGVGILLVARILDLAILLVLITISAFFFSALDPVYHIILIALLLLLIYMLRNISRTIQFGFRLIDKMPLLSTKIKEHIKQRKDLMIESFAHVQTPSVFWGLVGLTLCCWLALNYTFYVLAFTMGLKISFPLFVLGAVLAFLSSILPVGVGDFGTHEAGWTIGFLLIGLPKGIVIASGFSVHIIALFFALIVFLIFGLYEMWT
ncbi:lysylphosphatidylglycerol synthase transmembrane domain-containing protein [Candidatus Margulisiibacteriota bacterium]